MGKLLSDDEVFGASSGELLSDDEVFGAVKKAKRDISTRSWTETAKDTGVAVMGGAAGLVKSAGDLYGLATGNMDNAVSEVGKSSQEYWEAGKSEALKQKLANRKAAVDAQDGIAGKAWTAFADTVSDPALAGDMLAGNAVNLIPAAAVGRGVQVGLTAKTALAAGTVGKIATGAAIGTGAAQQATDVSSTVFDTSMKLPDATWEKNPDFMSALKDAGQDTPEIRKAIKEKLALSAARVTFPAAAAISVAANALPGGSMIEKALVGGAAKETIKQGSRFGIAGAVAKGAVGEAVSEGVEEGGGAFAGNVAKQRYVDASQDLADSVGENMGLGAAGGFAMGVGAGAMHRPAGGNVLQKQEQSKQQTRRLEPENDVEIAPKTKAKVSATETALRKPVELTALDRLPGIDSELNASAGRMAELTNTADYGPAFDEERTELQAKIAELQDSKSAITATFPPAVKGTKAQFSTEDGARLEGEYAVIAAADLVTSHDENLRANPLYPSELQPRDRSRSASEMQISNIVQKLDPARLGLSADAATGAPIVGADGLVESGNARSIALKRIYQADGLTADDYRNWLTQNAGQFGIAPESVASIENPVLVRIRQTPVNRAEFARQANASTVQRMSSSEQAVSDSKRLNSLDGLDADETGDFSASRGFIRQFMSSMPITEQSDMIEADGRLSTNGYRRVQNAILARAYGDSPTLRRMTESNDDNLRNISKALVRVAPVVAASRDRMKSGSLHNADLTNDLISAVEGLSNLKDRGVKVANELSQGELTGSKYTPEATALLQFLDDNIRSPRRIADFIHAYYDALESAGDPRQDGMFGPQDAPTKNQLLERAQSDGRIEGSGETSQRGNASGGTVNPQTDSRSGQQPQDATSRSQSNEGNGSAGTEVGKWVAFAPDLGSLGIPRAEMPQVKSEHRSALLGFLAARGINYEAGEVPASSLKPTQAEYSQDKVDKFVETGVIGTRSVLVSSDNHVLDGHHQWLGHLERNESIPIIRLNAPIKELLAVVNTFPSVKRSEGGLTDQRAAAVSDFKSALTDLAQIASKHTRAMMVPENTPDLMPTLVKLFDAAIRMVGTDVRAATKWVKAQLRQNEGTKTYWNKINDETYRKAALQALEKQEAPQQGSLFEAPEQASEAVQRGLFDGVEVAPSVAKIKGRAYDMTRDNFKALAVESFLDKAIVDYANTLVDKYFKDRPHVIVSSADRAKAESMLLPLVKRAKDVKPAFDQKIINIAKRSGSIGQMLAPIKSMNRAIEKLVTDENFDVSGMKDMLRSTIVVNSYADAQAVMTEIEKEFTLTRDPKNRTGQGDITARGKVIAAEDPAMYGGYTDVLMNVTMPNGVVAEIQINVPEMLSAKGDQGHKLYEAYREAKKDSPISLEIKKAMEGFYAAVTAAGGVSRKQMPSRGAPLRPDSMRGQDVNSRPSSENLNQLPSGNITKSSPPKVGTNSQPAGNLFGTGEVISDPFIDIVPKSQENTNNTPNLAGKQDANADPSDGSAQTQSAGTAGTTGQSGSADAIRSKSGRGNELASDDLDASGSRTRELGQPGANGVRSKNGNSSDSQSGSRAVANAGVPAGRDIPAKSGRNYTFGASDLTYEGAWFKKAEQNVAAVELLLTLGKEGRQATRDEQAKLAKFIGWGSSELANNIFGKKLDEAESALDHYDTAVERMGSKPFVNKTTYSEYAPAFQVIKYANPKADWYTTGNINRDMLDKARPDPTARKWVALRKRLKDSMTDAQWAEASRSTQYAHYTSKAVVSSMWKAMERMGFKGGTILEPGAGIGIFPGLMPGAMANNSVYTGIEFDSFTGGILKQLFPDERILVESFVDTKLPKNFYDVAIGNPPFSSTKILGDPEYAKQALSLHDYFFAKSIDRVKPGGLVVYVTSRYTMDKLNDKARGYLADRADLVGAIRLPQTAFKQNAGTEVVTDVIFLRKKVEGQAFEYAQPWAKSKPITVNGAEYNINEYFATNPDMVLGTHADTGSMYKERDYTVSPMAGDIEDHFAKAVERLPEGIYQAERGSAAEAAQVREIDFNPKAKKEGNYYLSDAGELMIREGGVGQRAQPRSQADAEIIKAYVPLRDALKQAHYDQLNNGDWRASLKTLQDAYKKFTAKHGQINQFTTKIVKSKAVDEETGKTFADEALVRQFTLAKKLEDDPDSTLVLALETINEDTGEIKPSQFLTERVLEKQVDADIRTPSDALLSSLNDIGRVDIGLIANRLGITQDAVIESLSTAIYESPDAGWQTGDEYLSGNVKRKLEDAREAVKSDKRFERNVTALEAAQPAPKTQSQININIGMNWVPGTVYSQFLNELANVKAHVEFNEKTKQWIVLEQSGGKGLKATSDFGTNQRNATDLLSHALTGRPLRVTSKVGDGKDAKTVTDSVATEAANQKLTLMQERFASWVWSDADRAEQLLRIYNDTFNTTVPRAFDGSHLTLPGSSKTFSVFDHVKRGAWRIIQRGNTYLAHAVGSGKTFQMVIAAMEQKRLGLIKKPMVVVPNHMLKQFANEWQLLYPAARLMVADENNFHTDNRRRFVSRVALSDLDGVIITHSAFKLLDLDPEFKSKMMEEQLAYMRASLEEAQSDSEGGNKSIRVKQIEKQVENMEEKLKAAMSSDGKDKNARFDELGVDFLMVDEAHEYRKLEFTTARQVKGITPTGSARAFDLYMKSRYLEEKKPGRALVMASGTPVTNTVAELYNVQRFMDRQSLIDKGIDDFDSWAAMFGRERTTLEPNAAGKYEPVTRFSKFVNVPELTQMFRDFADVLTGDHLAALLGDKRPKVAGGTRNLISTPKSKAYAEYQQELAKRVEDSKKWKPSEGEPSNPDPIIRIIGDGRLAAIDMRFVKPELPNDPTSKLNQLADGVIKACKDTADMEYRDKAGKVEPNKGAAMMVFSDLGFGAGVAATRGFNARAWFEKRLRDGGVNMGQVAFMSDYKKSAAKLKLFSDVNAGRVRVLIGSSKNMGTGVNAQQRLKKEFHLDSPWYPADLEQREGRIIRQGNKNPLVEIDAYAAQGTYDENMWKMLATKQYFIDQAMSGDPNLREIEDLDSMGQFDLIAGMLADNPMVLQLAGTEAEIAKLSRLQLAHEEQRMRFVSQTNNAKMEIAHNERILPNIEKQAAKVQDLSGDKFTAKAMGKTLAERTAWGQAIIDRYKDLTARGEVSPVVIGQISGFDVVYGAESVAGAYRTKVMLNTPTPVEIMGFEANPSGVSMRAQNTVTEVSRLPAKIRTRIAENKALIGSLSERITAPFSMRELLAQKIREKAELEKKLAEVDKAKTEEAPDVTEEPAILFSRGGSSVGLPLTQVKSITDSIKSSWKNAPKIEVAANMDDAVIPQAVRDDNQKQLSKGAQGSPEGFLYGGKVYLIADQLTTPTDVMRVLFHETLGHVGLRGTFGDALTPILSQIVVARRPEVAAKAKEYGFDMGVASDRLRAAEEVLAVMAQTKPDMGFVKRAVAAIRTWLRAHGVKLNLSDSDIIANYILPARQFIESGKGIAAGNTAFSRTVNANKSAAERADDIIKDSVKSSARPLEAAAKLATKVTGIEKLTKNSGTIAKAAIGRVAGFLPAQKLDTLREMAEKVKAGVVSDYGVPEAVIDRRTLLQSGQRVQLRQAQRLIDKLGTLTRSESRVAYEWMNMNGSDPKAYLSMMNGLPEESIAVLQDVQKMIDKLSLEAVRLGQLSADTYERHKFAYLRRSYAKHVLDATEGDKKKRARAISVLGDQYKGRGLVEPVAMASIRQTAPEWFGLKDAAGKADVALKGKKFLKLEKRSISASKPIEGMDAAQDGRVTTTIWWPADKALPAKYSEWTQAGEFEVRDTKGGNAIMWRDFTSDEREKMGEVDEARFAIAKTLQGMIHDVEVGRYLEWLGQKYAKYEGQPIPGKVIPASENMLMTFKPGEWVRVPKTTIKDTDVLKYGKLADMYLPGPVWNDLRQIVAGSDFKPFGENYDNVLRMWKAAKTALSPAVHTNNIMSNMVMADWHDVRGAHMRKSLSILLGASMRDGDGLIGAVANGLARAGMQDAEAAREILIRYQDSGGQLGSWATNEIAKEQLEPMLAALRSELGVTEGGNEAPADVGVFAALQAVLSFKFPKAIEALSRMGQDSVSTETANLKKLIVTEGKSLIDLYQAEDEVFRLAAWLKAKEDGLSDIEAGKITRKSFLDYNINAPWIAYMRKTAWPFIAFTYRAVPMLLQTARDKPHKLLKLMALAGALNALGAMMAGDDDEDKRRKLLPEEKAGRVWGIVPKLIRMPWNDEHGSAVYLDIRRYIPVGDIADVGATHSALPMLPSLMPGGPLVILGELIANQSMFTGQSITKDTDTAIEKVSKVMDHLYKALMPNLPLPTLGSVLPVDKGQLQTYSYNAIQDAANGKTDKFGRDLSLSTAAASAFGVKLGAYPDDVLRNNLRAKAMIEVSEVDKVISGLKRQRAVQGITDTEFQGRVQRQQAKKQKIMQELGEKMQ